MLCTPIGKMLNLICLCLTLLLGIVICEPTGTIKPCKKEDYKCMTAIAKAVFPKFVEGFPTLGVDTSDPLTVDEVIGDLAGLKYKFTDSSALGFGNCDVDDVKLNMETMKLSFTLICNNITMTGHYTIAGRLIVLPVEGEGEYTIFCKKYVFSVNADLKETKNSEGNQHITVKQYKYNIDDQGVVTYKLMNLFNGQKDLSDAVHKFANENWKEVANFVQEPAVSAVIKRLMKNLNHYLKLIPLSEMFLS